MAKDPIFPLYYNDIDRSTKTWTDEEFGAYMRLLMEQWDKGHLPNDYQRLTRIATSLDKNWAMLKGKFEEVDGVLKNPVLEFHRTKRLRHKQKQKENVEKRYQNHYQKDTKPLPLEIENENEYENKIDNGVAEDWARWGDMIVNDNDQYWEQAKGRKVSRSEMDEFLSVATRNAWKMPTAQSFRVSLKGFNPKTKLNGDQKKDWTKAMR